MATNILLMVQVFFAVVIGLYFWNLLKKQRGSRSAVVKESRKELDKLQRMREISLSEPLSEKTRPTSFSDIIGQEDGLKALRAALCGPNPQHIIIYGPPGIGKTAAARLVLEEAKKNPRSPFDQESDFIELDATTARFDERGIADPLIGSVHDPIYQGAGAMGQAGVPQPKPGAVTKAHGGLLFIDEIGELHPIQMNKLLKVLEDRKVFLESAYYNSEDSGIPQHIHDIFQNGLPADFRMVGATTRTSQEIPPAIRSRCLEVFFRSLKPKEIGIIARNAADKINFELEKKAVEVLKRYATNGRDAVNIIQTAGGLAIKKKQEQILAEDVEWVINSGQYSPRRDKKISDSPQVGYVNGLAVHGPNQGLVIEIEATTLYVGECKGEVEITGVIEEEEMGSNVGKRVRRTSLAKDSGSNVITVLRNIMQDKDPRDYDIHVNFPGGFPIDGPSAGISMATAIYSSLMNKKVDNETTMTGEVSVQGYVKPVGGIVAKVNAAIQAGAKRVIIPEENWQEMFENIGDVEIITVSRVEEVLEKVLYSQPAVSSAQEPA